MAKAKNSVEEHVVEVPAPSAPASVANDSISVLFRALKEFGIPTVFALAGLWAAYYVYSDRMVAADKAQIMFAAQLDKERESTKAAFKDVIDPVIEQLKEQNRGLVTATELLKDLRRDVQDLQGTMTLQASVPEKRPRKGQ